MCLPNISKEYAIANMIILAIIIIILVLPFAIMFAEQLNYCSLSSITIDCFVKKHTGHPCPTCGLTRSLFLLYNCHFQESVAQYAYGYIFVLLLIMQLFIRIILSLNSLVWIPYMDIAQMIFFGMIWFFTIH